MLSPTYFKLYRGLLAVILFSFLAVLLIVLAGYYIFTHKPLPHIQGEIELSGIESPVVVTRDRWGAPHIYAQSSHDLFFAVGYVQAQDRLFQMDLLRRTAQGRLAEWFGPEALPSDRLARVIGFHRQARHNLERLPPESQMVLAAFSDGVNALAESRKRSLPDEYRWFLKTGFEKWRPEDSLAIHLYLAWGFSASWQSELARHLIASERGESAMWELMPKNWGRPPDILSSESWPIREGRPPWEDDPQGRGWFQGPATAALTPEQALALAAADRSLRSLIAPAPAFSAGSNAWAVAGRHTASGKPLLANDPHLGLTLPALWFKMHLVGDGLEVLGATIPGFPVIILGRTRKTAWAATASTADVDDLYLEELDPANPDHYLYQGASEPFAMVKETIKVKNAAGGLDQETLTVRLGRRGPLLSDALGPEAAGGRALSLAWTGHELTDPVGAFLAAARAADFESFRSGIHRLGCPALNWLYADDSGVIAYALAGLIPVRARGQGLLPAPGSERGFDWQGYLPLEELPRVKDPGSGILVAANNRIISPERLPQAISFEFAPPYRAQRILELLAPDPERKFTIEDMGRIQLDTVSIRARSLLPVFLSALEKHKSEREDLERAWRQLKDWEGEMDARSSAPTIFAEAHWQTFRLTYQDEMSAEAFALFKTSNSARDYFDLLLLRGEAAVFDDRTSATTETKEDIIGRGFVEAIRRLSAESGPMMSEWRWGRFHRLKLSHPLGEWERLSRAAGRFEFNLPAIPLSGGLDTVNAGIYDWGESYEVKAGPSLRLLVDLGDADQTWVAYPGGQSGQPMSPYYRNLLGMWAAGERHPLLMSAGRVDQERSAKLVITPGGGDAPVSSR